MPHRHSLLRYISIYYTILLPGEWSDGCVCQADAVLPGSARVLLNDMDHFGPGWSECSCYKLAPAPASPQIRAPPRGPPRPSCGRVPPPSTPERSPGACHGLARRQRTRPAPRTDVFRAISSPGPSSPPPTGTTPRASGCSPPPSRSPRTAPRTGAAAVGAPRRWRRPAVDVNVAASFTKQTFNHVYVLTRYSC